MQSRVYRLPCTEYPQQLVTSLYALLKTETSLDTAAVYTSPANNAVKYLRRTTIIDESVWRVKRNAVMPVTQRPDIIGRRPTCIHRTAVQAIRRLRRASGAHGPR